LGTLINKHSAKEWELIIDLIKRETIKQDINILKLINGDVIETKHFARTVGLWVYGIIYNYVGNREDAEELCQDVLLAAMDSLSGFKKNSSLKTWVCSIAVNKCKDFLKYKLRLKRKHEKISLDAESHNGFIDYAIDKKHPGLILESREEIDFLMKAIDSLPGKQKDAIILCKLDKRSHRETAAILALSPKAVESLISRAKKNLMAYLCEKNKANYKIQINQSDE